MSKAACKVVIDWYASLGAEAAGLYVLASERGYATLSAEAFSLWEAAQGICEAGSEMVTYLEADEEEPEHVAQITALSREACDWSHELREYVDAVATSKKVSDAQISEWIGEMREWRDAGTTLIRTIAEGQIAES